MKLDLKELLGYKVKTLDGISGTINDFLFDEERWVIRYVDADLGDFFPGKRVLIPRMFLKETNWETKEFNVQLKNIDVEQCPELKDNLPISRKYEQQMNENYKLADYWNQGYFPLNGFLDITQNYSLPIEPVHVFSRKIIEKDLETNLRSYKDLVGYIVNTKNGHIGKVEALLIDSSDWSIFSVIVNLNDGFFVSKKVIIAISWFHEISYIHNTITVNLSTEEVASSPVFDASKPVNAVYIKKLFNYYGKPVEKVMKD